MNNRLFEIISTTAAQHISGDEKGFMAYDYCAGNIDAAYNIGLDHGEVYFARQLLRLINSENE